MRRLALALLPACYLPVATGAPESATTVGRGHLGVSVSGEAPTLDLIASNTGSGSGDIDYTSSYGEAPAAALRLTLAYGLGDDTDLEIAAEGQLWFFFLPLPTGASIGLRQHLEGSDLFDIALAARVGGVSSGSTQVNGMDVATADDASAIYGAFSGVVQVKNGFLRPLVSLNVMPFKVTRAVEGSPVQRFLGAATSMTFAIMAVGDNIQFGPYATLTNFESQQFKGGFFPSGGLMLSFRPDRNRPKPVDSYPPNQPRPTTPYPPGTAAPDFAPYVPAAPPAAPPPPEAAPPPPPPAPSASPAPPAPAQP
ncbi:MAG: hypothetical protein ABI467_06845 [Kofleriaceae bacterium]